MPADYEKYKALKKEKRVKDSQVSQATGIPKSTFSDWKSGRSRPKIDKLAKIAAYFGVTIDELVKNHAAVR